MKSMFEEFREQCIEAAEKWKDEYVAITYPETQSLRTFIEDIGIPEIKKEPVAYGVTVGNNVANAIGFHTSENEAELELKKLQQVDMSQYLRFNHYTHCHIRRKSKS